MILYRVEGTKGVLRFLRTYNAISNIKNDKETNNYIQNTTQKTKYRVTQSRLINRVFRKGKLFLLPSWYSSYWNLFHIWSKEWLVFCNPLEKVNQYILFSRKRSQPCRPPHVMNDETIQLVEKRKNFYLNYT